MFNKNIDFKNFKTKLNTKNVKKKLKILLDEDNEILKSLSKNYKYNFNNKLIKKFKKYNKFRLIGMGGSSLGAKAIYNFLKHKIKKKFEFINNLDVKHFFLEKKKFVNIIVSKSGNTVETVANANILIKRKSDNIFITENKKSHLYLLAEKLKADIIHHNNYIGGRYSVLSEVGMLPAELMGLKSYNFKQFNLLIKNKKFVNALISNVSSILYFSKQKKFNSIIINYDERSQDFFNWYQQLVAESLGKHKKGILPIISNMPKDNHSVMQLYLDGFKNNFYTFFHVDEKKSIKINKDLIYETHKYLKNKSISQIRNAQKMATEKVFQLKKIPFRSFNLKKRDEKILGELFSFFILETILIGKCLNLNPYDQPAVELIKTKTKSLLIS